MFALKDPDEKLNSRREVSGEEICESVKLGKGMRSVWNKVNRVKEEDFKRHQENMLRNSRGRRCSK